MKVDYLKLLEECHRVRVRVSGYSPKKKAELLKRARAMIEEGAKKTSKKK